MAINSNNPIKQAVESAQNFNQVSRTAIEAATDKVYDRDGDKTDFNDVKAAYNDLSPTEKVVFTAGSIVTGGALPVLSLAAEGAVIASKLLVKGAEKLSEAVQEKYKHPPEEKLAEQLKKGLEKAGEAIKEKYKHPPEEKLAEQLGKAIDSLKDGQIF